MAGSGLYEPRVRYTRERDEVGYFVRRVDRDGNRLETLRTSDPARATRWLRWARCHGMDAYDKPCSTCRNWALED